VNREWSEREPAEHFEPGSLVSMESKVRRVLDFNSAPHPETDVRAVVLVAVQRTKVPRRAPSCARACASGPRVGRQSALTGKSTSTEVGMTVAHLSIRHRAVA
jgi:hypothetical protein